MTTQNLSIEQVEQIMAEVKKLGAVTDEYRDTEMWYFSFPIEGSLEGLSFSWGEDGFIINPWIYDSINPSEVERMINLIHKLFSIVPDARLMIDDFGDDLFTKNEQWNTAIDAATSEF